MTSRQDDFKYPRAFLDPTDAFNARALENHLRQLAWDVVETSLRSENWDGGNDLSGGKDGTATQGFFLDVESGSIQAMSLFADSGSLDDLVITGGTITAPLFKTAASGTRLEIDGPSGDSFIQLFDASGVTGYMGWKPTGWGADDLVISTVGNSDGILVDAHGGLLLEAGGVSGVGVTIKSGAAGSSPGTILRVVDGLGTERFSVSTNGMVYLHGNATIMGDYLYFNGVTGHEYIQFSDASNWARFVLDNTEHFRVNTSGIQLPNAKQIDFAAHYSTYISENYGIELHGDPTHPVQILAPTLLGIDATGGTFTNGYVYHAPPTTGSAANACWILASGSIYYMMRSTSARKYKDQIDYGFPLADYELRPNKHWRLDDEKYFVGFIADDLAEQNPIFATYDEDGEVENYEDRAVLAVLAAKVNRLEELVLQGRE